MKTIVNILLIVVVLSACNKSPEQKAEVLIKDSLKKTLYKPETYKPVDTKIDSAFAPYDDPKIYEIVNEFANLGNKCMSLEEEIKDEEREIAIYSGPYQSEYAKYNIKNAQESIENKKGELEKNLEKVKEILTQFNEINSKGKIFIGYKVTHNYRADNNSGNTLIGNNVFFIDKDFKEVTYSMDLDEYNEMINSINK